MFSVYRANMLFIGLILGIATAAAAQSQSKLEIVKRQGDYHWVVETAPDGSRKGGWVSAKVSLDNIDRNGLQPIPPAPPRQAASAVEAVPSAFVEAPVLGAANDSRSTPLRISERAQPIGEGSGAPAAEVISYKVVATKKTSTMQKEMQEAADAGFRFAAVMGGETAFGGNEVVVVMQRTASAQAKYEYRLLATNKTSTLQKEMQEAADAGFNYVGQTVFESMFGGKEVASIFERHVDAAPGPRYEYRLLATNKTSTLQKELQEVGEGAYEVVGMTVGKTLVGGSELVAITRRPVQQ